VALKQAVGTDLIREREQRFLRRALARWRGSPNLELLGDLEVPRLPIVSFPVGEEALAVHLREARMILAAAQRPSRA